MIRRGLDALALVNEFNYIMILRAAVRDAHPSMGLTIRESTDEGRISLDSYVRFNREITPKRIAQRLHHGLRFYELHQDGRVVGSTWIVSGSTRFIDELGYHIPVPTGSFWIRDIFIHPQMRGRRLLGSFIDLLAAGPYVGSHAVWSDVSARNRASLRAHAAYGFGEVSRLKSRHFWRSAMMREIDLEGLKCAEGFKPSCRVLFTGPAFRRYCDRFLA